jgi:nodulation protein E
MRRIGATEIGVVSGVGLDRESFWQSLSEGRSGIAPIQSVDCSGLKFANGAEVRGFDPLRHFTAKEAAQLDRTVHLTGAAATEAMAGSGAHVDAARSAVLPGRSLGGKISEDETFRQLYAEKKTRFDPLTIPRVMANAARDPPFWCSSRSMRRVSAARRSSPRSAVSGCPPTPVT